MRDNSNDRTVERSYIQKWRFLNREYELVKAKKHVPCRSPESHAEVDLPV